MVFFSLPGLKEDGDPTLLELFKSRGCDEKTAVVMALDMIFAGIDTSSHTAAFMMYHLAENPEVQERLYQEVKRELPNDDSKMDRKSLNRMPYMKVRRAISLSFKLIFNYTVLLLS